LRAACLRMLLRSWGFVSVFMTIPPGCVPTLGLPRKRNGRFKAPYSGLGGASFRFRVTGEVVKY
jgi:hypothetical protein